MALENEDAPAVEGQDKVLPPSKRSLLSPCSTSASEMSDLRDLSMTSFLRGLRLVDPCQRPVVRCTLLTTRGQRHHWHLPPPPRARTRASELVPVDGEELRLLKQWMNCQTNWFLRLAP